MTLLASMESPAHNPAFQIKNWGGTTPKVTLNGQTLKRGQDYRLGHVARLDGTDLTVWIRFQDTEPLQIGVFDIETHSD